MQVIHLSRSSSHLLDLSRREKCQACTHPPPAHTHKHTHSYTSSYIHARTNIHRDTQAHTFTRAQTYT